MFQKHTDRKAEVPQFLTRVDVLAGPHSARRSRGMGQRLQAMLEPIATGRTSNQFLSFAKENTRAQRKPRMCIES